MIRLFWLAMFALSVNPALGAEESGLAVACPDKSFIRPFIMMCGHNKYVAMQARICGDAVVESWQAASQRLIPMLQSRGKISNQNISEEDARRNYQDTVNGLIAQIQVMQRYTAVIADYPKVMIDLGNSTGDSTSLSCFNEAFHKVQEIVSYLDDEIIRAKKLRKSTMSLRDLADSRHKTMENSLGSKIVSKPMGGKNKGRVPAGKSPRSSSTITGKIHKAIDFGPPKKPKP